jgi:hypothetical protein
MEHYRFRQNGALALSSLGVDSVSPKPPTAIGASTPPSKNQYSGERAINRIQFQSIDKRKFSPLTTEIGRSDMLIINELAAATRQYD